MPETDTPVLELRDLRAAYGRIEVLHGVDLTMRAGSVLALLGPNGAGKTTTIRCISGLLRPTGGHVHVAGQHVNGASPDALARAGVCTIPEGRGIFPNLTVRENLRVDSYMGADSDAVEATAYERFPRLGERREQLAGSLSGGEQQMLAISRALGNDPAVLLLDEFSMGLAPLIVQELYGIVAQIAQEGVSILVVEQFAHIALSVADEAAVMAHGRIQATGTPDEIESHLSGAYFGGTP